MNGQKGGIVTPCPGVGILKMIPCSAARPRTEKYMSTPPPRAPAKLQRRHKHPRVMSLQYGGGCQVQWRVPSTVEGYLAVQWGGAIMKYSGGCAVRWRVIMQYSGGCKYGGGLSCSTVEGASTVEGYLAVRWRAICSTVEGASTVEGYLAVRWRVQVRWRTILQYSGGLSCSTVEGASTVEGYLAVRWRAIIQYGGGCEVQWRL